MKPVRDKPYDGSMDRFFDLLWRDAIDTARMIRWLGRWILGGSAQCGRCHDNPVRSCNRCYEDCMGPR